MKAQTLLIGVLAVLVSVAVIWFLASRGKFSPEDQETPEERVEQQRQFEEDFSIPLRDRYRSLSGAARTVVASLSVAMLVAGYFGYRVVKTGSPATQYLSVEVLVAMVGLVGIVAGIKFEQWVQNRIGELHVVYERLGDAPQTKTIRYFKDKMQMRDGRPVVHELADSRLFGIFHRHRMVGEERDLRASAKPNGDIISHMVPDHGAETETNDWVVRTWQDTSDSGEHVDPSPSAAADYKYSSPNSLSDEDAVALRQKNRRMRIRLNEIKSTNAELYDKVSKMRQQLENEEYKSREDFQRDLAAITEQLAPLLQSTQSSLTEGQQENGSAESVLADLEDDD